MGGIGETVSRGILLEIMTPQEIKVLDRTKEAWAEFLSLPEEHPDDQNEFRFHIHALQNIILAREGMRKLKEIKQ